MRIRFHGSRVHIILVPERPAKTEITYSLAYIENQTPIAKYECRPPTDTQCQLLDSMQAPKDLIIKLRSSTIYKTA
jgi:hypothetical protein